MYDERNTSLATLDMYEHILLDLYRKPEFRSFFQSYVNNMLDKVPYAADTLKYHYEYHMSYVDCIPYVLEIGDWSQNKIPDDLKSTIIDRMRSTVERNAIDAMNRMVDGLLHLLLNNQPICDVLTIDDALDNCDIEQSVRNGLRAELKQLRFKAKAYDKQVSSETFESSSESDKDSDVSLSVIVTTWLETLGINPDMDIAMLMLNTRTYNALARADIFKLKAIIKCYKTGEIYKIRNLGASSIAYLSKVLIDLGIPEAYVPVMPTYDDYPYFFNETEDMSSAVIKTPMLRTYVGCIETGKVYLSINSASKATGIEATDIRKSLMGEDMPNAKFHWVAVDNVDNLDVEYSLGNLKTVIRCIETDKFYKSINSAHRLTGVSIQSLSAVLNGRTKTANNYHWERIPYTDSIIVEHDATKYKNSVRRKKVRCIETGEVFKSIAEASRTLNIDAQNISNAVNGNRASAGGYHWERVSKS